MIKSYRDLDVWRLALEGAKDIYLATRSFPSEERFGLVNQMRRAAVSIASNIAEGHARSTTAEFQRFILIAMGSVAELETQVILSGELGFLAHDTKESLLASLDVLGKKMRSLHQALARRRKA